MKNILSPVVVTCVGFKHYSGSIAISVVSRRFTEE